MGKGIRWGVIGDVHCEDGRLETSITTLMEAGADTLIQVGDIVDGRGSLERCVELLKAHDVQTIAGNHERWFLTGEMRELKGATLETDETSRSFLRALPPTRRFETPKGGLLVCHGVGEDDMANLRPDTRGYALQAVISSLRPLLLDTSLRFMLGGHTHQRMVRTFEGLTVINAGTLVEHGGDHEPPGFILLDVEADEVLCWDFEGDEAKPGESLKV
ncbi:MAG: metallophosphoesterase [Polyangiales bacterium]